MPLSTEVALGPGNIVLVGDPAPLPKKTDSSPQLSAHVLWPNGFIDQDAIWYGGRPWPWRHCVKWGRRRGSPLPKGISSPQFSAHVYCGQTAGWIKMPLGREVDFGPCHIVLNGDPALSSAALPQFSANLLRPNGWMDQDATSYGDRPRSEP